MRIMDFLAMAEDKLGRCDATAQVFAEDPAGNRYQIRRVKRGKNMAGVIVLGPPESRDGRGIR